MKQKRLFNKLLPIVMLIVCSILGTTDAWAGGGSSNKTYYSKLTATATGSGKVYVNTTNSKGSDSSKTQNSSATSAPTHTYNIFAEANTGYSFKSWSGSSATVNNANTANTTATVIASSTEEKSPTSGTVTATFVQIFQFKAFADYATGSAGFGDIAVSFATGSPDYKTAAVTATDTQNGADANTSSVKKTAHYYAQKHTGAEFRGWYSDAAGTNLKSENVSYSQEITSTTNDAGLSPQLTLYAKFEKVAVEPTWTLEGVAGTAKTLEIGETIKLVTETDGNSYSWGTPSYVDASETNPVMNYDPATKTFTANRAGTVTIRFTQTAGEDTKGVLWKAGEQTFTFTVEKLTPRFAWADPLPHFTVGTTLPTSELFSFTPAEAEQNWTLTSSDPTNVPSIASGAAGLFMPKEVTGVTLTFHQAATWKWKEIENTSIKINVTKEPVLFGWKDVALVSGHTYSWTDIVETNSEGAWNLMSDDESVIPTMRSIANTSATVSSGTATLTFTQGQDLGHDAVPMQTKTFDVYPAMATYKVGSTVYDDLHKAIAAANGGSSRSPKYIFVVSDGVVAPGEYTLPAYAYLVVPYESTNTTKYITAPNPSYNSTAPIVPYRTLKLVEGVKINVGANAAICVGAEVQSGDASHNPTGFPVGPVGVIDMSKGGEIVVKSSGTLYAWGFIKGEGYLDGNNTTHVGKVTAESGSTIWECFGMGDWNGGSFTMAAGSNSASYRIFPFQSYFVQNIEIPLHMKYGSEEKLYTNFYGNNSTNSSTVTFISYDSNTALFLVNSNNGTVIKRYDPTTDHMVVDLEGDSKLGALSIKVLTTSVNSSGFDMPIVNNMHIRLIDCDLTLTTPIRMFPGSVLEVTKGSKLTVSTNVFMHDHDDWEKTVNKHYFGVTPKILSPHVALGDNIDVNTLEDAKMIVDGEVVISSKGIFTSPAGANIMGNGGGTFKWSGALPADTKVYAYTLGNSVTGDKFSSKLDPNGIVTTTCNPAKLHNDAETANDSYTAAVGSKTFYNVNGRWFVQEDKDEKTDHTYNFKYLNDGNTVATPAVYTSDKTGLMAGYKWMNVALDNDFCGGKTFLGEDGNYYYYDGASKDAVSKWVQLVKLNEALYSGSDNNLYAFTSGCAWASVGEIGDDCMYTVDGVKMALVGTEFIALQKDEYDEVYVDASGNYYMLFDGCVWQHATKIPDTYKAYEVLGNPYIWLNDEWSEVAAEGAYFYTTDDQSIKHYYEFDNTTFAWVPVRNKVRITTPAGDRRDFLSFDDAIAYLSQYNNPTVTLLEDVVATKPQTITPGSKSTTATIDLNGHKVTATSTLQYMWQVNSTVNISITDNSDKGNGELHVSGNYGGQFRGFWVVKGGVQMDGGKLFVENTNTAQTVAAIYLPAGTHAVVNGGEIDAVAVKGAFVIDEASTAATNNAGTSYISITGGMMTGRATTSGYGIRCYCPITVSGGTINAITETMGTTAGAGSAYGIYLNVSSSAVDANSYRATLTMSNGTINANSATSTAHAIYANAAVSAIANGKKSDGTTDNTYKSTDGSESNKAAAHVDITGGNLNATCGTSTSASGITVVGCYNSYTDKSEANQKPHTIKNVKIRTSANGTAYGILVTTTGFADLTGGIAYGNVIIDNVDAYAETTGSTNAFGLYVNAAALWMNRAKYYNISAANRKLYYVEADANDGDLTHEAIAQTGTKCYKYHIGNHVQGAKAVVNGGTFYAKCATTGAYGLYVNTAASSGDNSRAYPEVTINGGTFTGESQTTTAYGIMNYGHTTVNAGTFNGIAATTDAYGTACIAGTLTLKGGTYNATSNGNNSYGIAASGTIDGTYGFRAHGTVDVYDGVVVNARSTAGGAVYGIYCLATSREMTPALYDASTVDKTQIFCLNEDGTIYKNATANTTNDSKPKNLLAYRCGTHLEGGIINVHGGTINATAYTSTAAGVESHMSNIVRTTEVGRFGTARGTVNVYDGTFNVTTETGATASGVRSYGIANIEGGTFNMTSKTSDANGVRVYDGTTTVNGGTFNINAMTTNAYGVYTLPDYDTNYGYAYSGEIIVNGGTFNVKTYGGDTSYGAYSTGGAKAVGAAKVTGKPNTDIAIAGSITINGGEFIMTPSSGKAAYGMVVSAPNTYNAVKAYSRGTINGGFFKMVGTSSIAATGSSAVEDSEGVPQLQVKGGHFSTKANLEQASPKNYVRDPYNIIACVHPEYKKDYPFEVAEVCTITFKDDEDHTLWSGKQPKGTMAIYPLNNGTPEKAATSTNSYDFTGWDTPLATITGDATYVANFDAVAKRFMVTWKDEAGNEIDHKEWASGQTPTHDDPVKEGYTFTGWTPSIKAVVDEDQNYKATFSINSYTIVWLDEDGSEIKRETKQYGSTLTAPKPTKEGYTFKVWTPGVEKVTGDQTYQASYLLNVAEVTDASTGKTTPYTTWSSALTAANKLTAGGTLKVLDDVKGLGAQTFTQTFTLDLNGHTLASATTKFITMNTAGKTLTIDDSKGGGRIELIAATDGETYAVFINNGTVILNNGTIHGENVHATAADARKGIGVRVETVNGKFVMNGGRVEGQSKQIGTGIYAAGPVEVYGGEIIGTARTKSRAIYTKGATLIVNNAYLEASSTVTLDAFGIYSDTSTPVFTIDNVTIKATANTTGGYGLNLYSGNKGTISNVKIQATTAPIDADATNALSITSGFFDKETNLAKYIGTKKVVALVSEPEKAEGYNYKIVDAAYQVTFKNEEGSVVLQQTNVEKGLQPVYVGDAQTKASTPKYAYDFDGWIDASDSHVYTEAELPAASKDVVYTAHFAQRAVEYPITFSNIDGKGNDYVQMVAYGEEINYDGPTPYMSGAVSNYAYTFIGWDPELAVVDGPASYSPRYDLVISHNVSFVINNASATTPTTLVVAEGAAVERPADQLVDCQHIVGWYKDAGLNEEWNFASDKLGEEDLILYAKWETKTYTITWLDEFGDEIDQTVVNCGVVPTHANLYKSSTAAYSYEWKGWNKTLVAADADATYKSLGFTQVAKRYAITFNTNGGSVIAPIEQEVGSAITPPADPTREGYTFVSWTPAIPATMPAEDMTITASWTVNQYTITFDSNGGSDVASITADFGAPITKPANPTKTGYTFENWTPAIPSTMPAENLNITANWTINKYTIRFENEGGALLQSVEIEHGQTPAYTGTTPTKTATAEYTYTHNGWTPAIVEATENATYTATFAATKNKYTIIFQNEDGTELQKSDVEYGVIPSYTGATPAKTATAEYTYTFKGWDTTPVAVTGAATYTATFNATKNKYPIIFKNEDGTELQKSDVEYGVVPSYTGATPGKTATAEYTYTFKGWNTTPVAVTGAATYTATFTATKNKYTIIFKNEDGTELQKSDVEYGVVPSYTGATPAKTATAQYTYTFKGWDVTPVAVTGAATYTATFNATTNKFTITWTDENDVVLGTDELEYGAIPSHADLTKAETAEYTYSWKGWNKEVVAVTDADTYKSLGFTATPKSYTLAWDLNGGDITTPGTAAGSVAFGASLTAPVVEKTGYEFNGWGPTVPATMPAADATYTAQWRANQYTITFDTDGGTEIAPISGNYGDPIPAPADPEKTGYTFTGWDATIPGMMPAENMTINASWTPIEYTITYEGLEGASNSNPTSYTIESATINFADPGERAGYTFNGWSPASIATGSTGDKTVTASWTINELPLSEDINATSAVTITENRKVKNLTISENGSVTIDDAATVTVVDNLLLEATPDNNLGAVLSGNIKVQGNAYIDINMNGSGTMDKRYYYSFAVPFPVNVYGGVFRMDGTTAKPITEGTGFIAYKYNEAERATKGKTDACWTPMKNGDVFQPGVFYLILFANSTSNTYRFQWNGDGSVNNYKNIAVTTTGNNATNSGWHGIANNGLGYTNMTGDFTIMQTLNSETNAFVSFTKTNPIAMANPVFVQMATGTINLSAPTTKVASAPRRVAPTEETELMNVRLTREGADKHDDQIFFSASEEAENQYTLGKDVAKMFMGTAKTAQLWINAYGERLVANEAVLNNDEARYSLSLYAPAAGDYMINVNDNDNANDNLYLLYEGAPVWNLSLSGYSIHLEAGMTEGYEIVLKRAPRVTTGMENVIDGETVKAQKILFENKLFIINGEHVFDGQGKLIK